MAIQPKIGTEGVHLPSICCFCRKRIQFLARSLCAGVSAARHKPSHSPTSAQGLPASCVGILQIGYRRGPDGPQRPPDCSQASCVRGISKCDPHDFIGIAYSGWPTATHLSPEQVQYPAAWVNDVLPAQSKIANKTLRRSARSGRIMIFIGWASFSHSKALRDSDQQLLL